jgi:type II secretory pathway pseudopilin PulG
MNGFSLVDTVIAIGISSIVIAGVTSFFILVQNEAKALTEKVASAEIESLITSALLNGDVCSQSIPAIPVFPPNFPPNFLPKKPPMNPRLPPPTNSSSTPTWQKGTGPWQFSSSSFPPTTPLTLKKIYDGKPVPAGQEPAAIVSVNDRLASGSKALTVERITIENIKGIHPAYNGILKVKFMNGVHSVDKIEIPVGITTTSSGSTIAITGCSPPPLPNCAYMGGTWLNGQCTEYLGQSAVSLFGRNNKIGYETQRTGPEDSILVINNQYAAPDSVWAAHAANGKFDGATCNTDKGWRLAGCFGGFSGTADLDIISYSKYVNGQLTVTGCMTNDGSLAEFVIECVKNF